MKKIAIGCGIILILGIGFVILMFYVLSLPKYRDVAKDKPFIDIINKKLITKKPTLIIKNPGIPKYENYMFHLEDGSSYGMNSDLETITELPPGTEIIIEKTEIHTNRVSGTSTAYLFGRVSNNQTEQQYPFEYTWGNYHSLYEDKPYWTFNHAFWQDSPLAQKFFIKTP